MSLHAVLWAYEQDLKPIPKLILVAIASFANPKTCTCFPKVKTLARMASVSPRTIHRWTKRFCELGLLCKTPNFKKTKSSDANTYWLPCGIESKTKSGADSSDRRPPDNAGRTDDHYSNHYLRSKSQARSRVGNSRERSETARAALAASRAVDQEAQNELARRVGPDGWEILAECSDEVDSLVAKLRKGMLYNDELIALRARYDLMLARRKDSP